MTYKELGMEKQYTNKLTPEVLAEFAQSPFSAEDLAAMDDEARALVAESDDYSRRHPVTAIWRHAVVGSLTRNGGTVSSASSGGKIITSSGKMAGMALVGDQVTYPDGTSAWIISGAGYSHQYGVRGFALVGSKLDNGDDIISTPQNISLLTACEGIPMADDFLVAVTLETDAGGKR